MWEGTVVLKASLSPVETKTVLIAGLAIWSSCTYTAGEGPISLLVSLQDGRLSTAKHIAMPASVLRLVLIAIWN
jgi:hypothetical protein